MRWVLLFLLLVPGVSAIPFLVDGSIALLGYEVNGTRISGHAQLTSTEEIGFIDGAVLVSLVASDTLQPPYADVQEWRVAERLIADISGFRRSVVVPFSIEVPEFAPPGGYRVEFYAKNGRRYLASYAPAMDTVAYLRTTVQKPLPAHEVPVIDLLATKAEDLSGAYGPFVDKDTVLLTIAMTDPDIPFDVRVTSCPWDDTAMRRRSPEPRCFSRMFRSENSPLVTEFPLPRPGSYGLKVEAMSDGVVTSISRLRAVRNGTSARIATVAPVEETAEGVILRSELLPSADGSKDPTLIYRLVVRTHDAVVFESEDEYAYPVPVTGIPDTDRSLTLYSTVPIHDENWYELEGTILSADGEVIDAHVRTVDFCGAIGYCCHPDVSAGSVRTLPPVIV